ncbi:16S rRNA (cytidine1402-2'-O)-methyltransferase [Pilibacter termitis]|uniref:Ribosomal RNA small subunit methyltransferase I n=1 Tax=Pilibacter termitis TaxID=263852 RepID=A0A1T4PBG7_9ENTE|nr:16S rRNA (cytidine(1402)-2'-O)-methyltransferase [Pilibacter termitis]SJZ88852.1 16S rRNA (cytidine1402-2'-O)-methyltransferase [Pilibacter termitis]
MNIQKSFNKNIQTGTLYLVPTPIGNLEDMTIRAIHTLRDVDVILSEDTRNTQRLLNHFSLKTKQLSFHEHNIKGRIPEVVEKLHTGINFAQVSDAGLPSISDPGRELVEACVAENLPVVALPGATAGVTALIASGLSPQPFTFYGFLPRKKKEQLLFFEEHKGERQTQIFYESPFRILATLENAREVYGERMAVVARELTKLHEEYRRGLISEIIESLKEKEVKGEIVLLIEGAREVESLDTSWEKLSILDHIKELENQGLSNKEAIKEVAKLRKVRKQEVYRVYHQ